MRLTWVQPEDLLPHELVQSAAQGRDVRDAARRWAAAGGGPAPLRAGASAAPPAGVGGGGGGPAAARLPAVAGSGPATAPLRALALELLDELDAQPPEPTGPDPVLTGLAEIESRCAPADPVPAGADLPDRIAGGWTGRAAGCLLGKPVEKLPREGIRELLSATGRWPLADYFTARGLPPDVAARWPWNRRSAGTSLAENIDGMPEDDDLNFTVLALGLLERYGDDLDTDHVAAAWLDDLPAGRVFTAERAAYRNLLEGIEPPLTATVRNPFREWIGAAIRADAYGWACPGDPRRAARLAYRDASLSHVRNGAYAAMSVAAMTSTACVAGSIDAVLAAGLAAVPPDSAIAGAVRCGTELGRSDLDVEAALDRLQERYGALHWVHSVNNAALVAYALARSRGDFGTAICIAVSGGWDTDSAGATAGSICGTLAGRAALPERWVAPLRDRLASSLPGCDGLTLAGLAARTTAVAAR